MTTIFLNMIKKKWVILETNKLQILLMNLLRAQKLLHIKLLPRFKVLRAANPFKEGKMLLFSLISERSTVSNFLSMGKLKKIKIKIKKQRYAKFQLVLLSLYNFVNEVIYVRTN